MTNINLDTSLTKQQNGRTPRLYLTNITKLFEHEDYIRDYGIFKESKKTDILNLLYNFMQDLEAYTKQPKGE